MKHLVFSVLSETKSHKHPIAIYGAGGLAIKILDFLQARGGGIDAFVIDKQYITPQAKYIKGIPVLAIDEFVEQHEMPEIIIGFEGNYRKNMSQEVLEKICKIYAVDFLGFLAGDENYMPEEYYNHNKVWYDGFCSMLEDEKSKIALNDFIEQKLTGKYEKEYDCGRQYFDYKILGDKITDAESFVDCGGFHGETVEAFISFLKDNHIDSWKHIYSLEPDYENVLIMKETLKDIKNLDIIEAGAYSKTGKVSFESSQGSSSRISDCGENSVQVVSLDDCLKGKEVTFIKMDIEGSELAALRGAEEIICKNKPKLAICIYHKKEDLLDIPQYLMSLNLGYKFFVRNYSRCGVETVLYAV